MYQAPCPLLWDNSDDDVHYTIMKVTVTKRRGMVMIDEDGCYGERGHVDEELLLRTLLTKDNHYDFVAEDVDNDVVLLALMIGWCRRCWKVYWYGGYFLQWACGQCPQSARPPTFT